MWTSLFQEVTAPSDGKSSNTVGSASYIYSSYSGGSRIFSWGSNQRVSKYSTLFDLTQEWAKCYILPNFQKGHELETDLLPANGVVDRLLKFGILTLKGRNIILSKKS